jgi:hypothetical protein
MNGALTSQESIFFPMLALVALTFAVALMIPYRRLKAAGRGEVSVEDFDLGESTNVPADVRIPNRNFMNLLEMPVLFYVACLTLYITKSVDPASLVLAWLYLALRAAHSIVHVTYNKVFHRLAAYAASNVILAVIWLRVFLMLAT